MAVPMQLAPLLTALALAGTCTASAALDCAKAVTTLDMNACAADDVKAVDARLNAVYQRIMKNLSKPNEPGANYAEMKATLLDAQRLWARFREADCKAIYTRDEAGSIRNLSALSCKKERAEQRIKELESYEREG